jgi:hypothetical protein
VHWRHFDSLLLLLLLPYQLLRLQFVGACCREHSRLPALQLPVQLLRYQRFVAAQQPLHLMQRCKLIVLQSQHAIARLARVLLPQAVGCVCGTLCKQH